MDFKACFMETHFAAIQCVKSIIGINPSLYELNACFFLKKILEEQRRLKREQEEADTAARRHAGMVVTHQQFITNDRFGDLLVINEKEKRKNIEVTYFLFYALKDIVWCFLSFCVTKRVAVLNAVLWNNANGLLSTEDSCSGSIWLQSRKFKVSVSQFISKDVNKIIISVC